MSQLTFQLTWDCNLRCAHCCQSHVKTDLPLDTIDSFISSARKFGITRIGFTGGEPFLKRDLLFQAAKIAYSHRFPFGIVTSGYWARNDESTAETLNALCELGLASLVLSIDKYHQEFVHFDKILRISRILPSRVNLVVYGCFNDDQERYEIQRHMGEIDLVRPNSQLMIRSVGNIGHGKDIYSGAYAGNIWSIQPYCRSDTEINIWPDGTALPCCSTFTSGNLSVGKFPEKSVEDIFEGLRTSNRVKLCKKENLKIIAMELDSRLFSSKKFENECELCKEINEYDLDSFRIKDEDPIDRIIFQ